jgi:large subunit ribosomal protein L27
MGKDFTLHARVDGTVVFSKRKKNRTFVSIQPEEVVETVAKAAPVKEKAAPKPAAPVADVQEMVAETQAAVAEAPKEEAKSEEPKAKKSDKITLPSGKKIKQDDLKIVEGIGPKIEGLLHDGGIKTWADLADAPAEKVQAILDEAGPRYNMHDPATWSKQAQMANDGQWEELEAYQDRLDGGREVSDEEE